MAHDGGGQCSDHDEAVDTMIGSVYGRLLIIPATASALGVYGSALAEESPAIPPAGISAGDTAWVLASSALVLLMIVPGLALFYGGLVRTKNVLATIMHSFAILCLITLLWIFLGYSLAFGPDHGGLIGGFEWTGLWGVGMSPNPTYAPTIPHQAFMVFQLMFAAITPALITGAFAERMRFSALLLFAAVWSLLIYCPIAHWMWGGGWLSKWGALDFAGGAVVHISSGAAALVCAFKLGPRRGYGIEHLAPHNLPLTLLGTGLLWFGWFGFNAGSALGANEIAVNAFITTHAAAAAGAFSWLVVEWHYRKVPTVLGMASGAIAGLATITPAAGYVSILAAVAIGLTAGLASYWAIVVKAKWAFDDSLDVVGIHGVGGCVGIIATGLFASTAVNAHGANGLFFGDAYLLAVQIVAALCVAGFSMLGTWLILTVIDRVVGLRVSQQQEELGLDLSQHNERAYSP
jgi:Amt family ammonium transporter